MKLFIQFSENGPIRSLNRIVGGIFAVIAFAATVYVTGECFDAEMRYQDLKTQQFLNK